MGPPPAQRYRAREAASNPGEGSGGRPERSGPHAAASWVTRSGATTSPGRKKGRRPLIFGSGRGPCRTSRPLVGEGGRLLITRDPNQRRETRCGSPTYAGRHRAGPARRRPTCVISACRASGASPGRSATGVRRARTVRAAAACQGGTGRGCSKPEWSTRTRRPGGLSPGRRSTGTWLGGPVLSSLTDAEREELSRKLREKNEQSRRGRG